MKTLIAVAIAGAFAVPFTAQASADGDRMILAQTGAERSPAAGTSTAAERPDTPQHQFSATDLQQLDANRDNYVSREEADKDPSMKTRFSELDKDNDGRISRSEWQQSTSSAAGGASGERNPAADQSTAAQRPATRQHQFSATDLQQLDTDRDGYISRTEADSHPEMKSRFGEYDADRDERLSKEEWGAIGAPRGAAVSGGSNTPPAGGPGVGGTSAQRQPVETGGKPSK